MCRTALKMEGISILKRTDICVRNVNDVVEDNIFLDVFTVILLDSNDNNGYF